MRVMLCAVLRRALLQWALLVAALLFAPAAEAKQKLKGPFPFEVVDVIDGDTYRARVHIWLGQTVTVKIRVKGIDTPEMNGRCAAEKELAKQAKAFAARWLSENPAQLTNVHYGTYAGRVLATTQTESGGTLAAALLSQNLAKPYRGRKAKWCA